MRFCRLYSTSLCDIATELHRWLHWSHRSHLWPAGAHCTAWNRAPRLHCRYEASRGKGQRPPSLSPSSLCVASACSSMHGCTPGTKKLQLDIFQEEQADERAHLQTKLDQVCGIRAAQCIVANNGIVLKGGRRHGCNRCMQTLRTW